MSLPAAKGEAGLRSRVLALHAENSRFNHKNLLQFKRAGLGKTFLFLRAWTVAATQSGQSMARWTKGLNQY